MAMPGRKYSAANGYKYGFNGQENDKELNESITTALYWEYDSRIGRRWNLDPEVKDNESPYACFGANPVFFSDILGNQPGNSQPGPKQPEPVNLTASQTSKAITTALFAIHTNTIEKRNYFVSSMAPDNKQPMYDKDLYDTQPENVASIFGLKNEQVGEFAKVYKNYYNNFATIGMWYDGSKTIAELYKAMEQVSPDKQYKLANDFIKDFVAKNARWQEVSKAGVTFGNILLLYGGQQLEVGNGVKGAFKSKIASTPANGVNIPAGGVKFGTVETAAANRLGFQAGDVAVKSGVADIPIIYMSSVKIGDLTTVFNALKSIGATAARINSGPIINKTIISRLAAAAKNNTTILGFKVTATGNPNNMFILEKAL